VAAPAFRLRLTLVQGLGRARIRQVLRTPPVARAPYGPSGELILRSRVVPGDVFRETIPLPILGKGWLPYSAVACFGDELPQ